MEKLAKEKNWKGGSANFGIILLVAIVVIAVGIGVYFIVRGRGEDAEEKRNVVVTQENAEEVVDEMAMDEYIEPGYYSVSMTNEWHFPTGDAVSEDAYVANKEENTNDVYFDVFLASDEENPIFQSPVIPRGAELENISLDVPLDAGNYDCVMVYHLVDEDQNTISTLRVGFAIIVER